MAKERSGYTGWVAALVVFCLLFSSLQPLFRLITRSAFTALLLLVVAAVFVLAVFAVLSLGRALWDALYSPEARARHEEARLAAACCDRVMEFLVFTHPIIREPHRSVQPEELSLVDSLGTRVWALTDSPPDTFFFALGAVNHRAGRFEEAVYYLDRFQPGGPHATPPRPSAGNPKLPAQAVQRAYDEHLRNFKGGRRRGNAVPQAVDFFESQLEQNAVALLADARRQVYGSLLESLVDAAGGGAVSPAPEPKTSAPPPGTQAPPGGNAPPPITEVLRRVYDGS